MVQRLGAGHGIYNNRPRIVTAKKYSAMRIRRPPLILRIVVSLLRRAFINPVPASIKATETYQQASIAAAAIPINPVSNQLESESTRWLNIARKNRATFGLRREIRNPSPVPLSNSVEPIDRSSFYWTGSLSPTMIVRNPIYAIRNAPDVREANKMLD